jgi:hypothetical protein
MRINCKLTAASAAAKCLVRNNETPRVGSSAMGVRFSVQTVLDIVRPTFTGRRTRADGIARRSSTTLLRLPYKRSRSVPGGEGHGVPAQEAKRVLEFAQSEESNPRPYRDPAVMHRIE